MKKIIYFLLLSVFIVVAVVFIQYSRVKINRNKILKENQQYIMYDGGEITISKVITIMNTAIESNNKNGIKKDEKGFFIENDTNSVKVFLEMESRGSIIPMEDLIQSEKAGAEKVSKLFSDLFFEYKEVEYHKKTRRIKKIVFRAIE